MVRERSCVPAVSVLVALATCVSPADARPRRPAELPPPIPATRPARPDGARPTTRPAGRSDERARELLGDALAKYRRAKTHRDGLQVRIELRATDKQGRDAGDVQTFETTLRYAAPNRLAMATDAYAIYSDGKKLWLYSDLLQQYKVRGAPERLNLDELRKEVGVEEPPHLVMYAIQHPGSFAELFPQVGRFSSVRGEELERRPGTRLSGTFDATNTPLGVEGEIVPFSVWIDDETGLVGEVRFDLTEGFRRSLDKAEPEDKEEKDPNAPSPPAKVEAYQATLRFRDAAVGAELDPAEFLFQPPPDAKEVQEFDWEAARPPDARDLLGEPAPKFTATTFDERPIGLEDFAGRIVVLNFWATYAEPAAEALPALERMYDERKGRGVAFVGVNQDARTAERKARDRLADAHVSFLGQVFDPEGKIGKQYQVTNLPTTVLIDDKGVIQAVFIGFAKDMVKELDAALDKLLKGESLLEPTTQKSEGEAPKDKTEPQKKEPPPERPRSDRERREQPRKPVAPPTPPPVPR